MGLFNSLVKVTTGVVATPFSMVSDAVNIVTGNHEDATDTVNSLEAIVDGTEDVIDDIFDIFD
jgi:hypothetical protein